MQKFGCRLKSVAVAEAITARFFLPPRYASADEYRDAFRVGRPIRKREDAAAYTYAEFAALFPYSKFATRPWVIELGSGTGGFLIEAAKKSPDKFFIGVDAAMPCTERSLNQLEKEGLDNILFYNGLALDFLQADMRGWPISLLLINFPDPWPKKRHLKRRMVSRELVKAVAASLAENGFCVTVTDIEKLSREHQEILDQEATLCPLPWTEESADLRGYYDFVSPYGKKNLAGSQCFFYTLHQSSSKLSSSMS